MVVVKSFMDRNVVGIVGTVVDRPEMLKLLLEK